MSPNKNIDDFTVLVVPCFNEATRLPRADFLTYAEQQPHVRLVLVDDGSKDGTGAILKGMASERPGQIFEVSLAKNCGKAEAVRAGLQFVFNSERLKICSYFGYWDADLATPLQQLWRFVEVFHHAKDTAIVTGARIKLLGWNIDRRMTRHYLGRVFATFASMILNLPVYDTQCGAKLFRNTDVNRKLFAEPFSSRWFFDVEIFARIRPRNANTVAMELPLHVWKDKGASKVKVFDFMRAPLELFKIWRRY